MFSLLKNSVAQVILVLTFSLASVSAHAFEIESARDSLVAVKERLNLTEQQIVLLMPIIDDAIDERMRLLDTHGFKPFCQKNNDFTFTKLRQIRGDFKALRLDTRTQVETILSDEQMLEWDKIQLERRERIQELIIGR